MVEPLNVAQKATVQISRVPPMSYGETMNKAAKKRIDTILFDWAGGRKFSHGFQSEFIKDMKHNRRIVIIPGDIEPFAEYEWYHVEVGSMFLAHFGVLGYYLDFEK